MTSTAPYTEQLSTVAKELDAIDQPGTVVQTADIAAYSTHPELGLPASTTELCYAKFRIPYRKGRAGPLPYNGQDEPLGVELDIRVDELDVDDFSEIVEDLWDEYEPAPPEDHPVDNLVDDLLKQLAGHRQTYELDDDTAISLYQQNGDAYITISPRIDRMDDLLTHSTRLATYLDEHTV